MTNKPVRGPSLGSRAVAPAPTDSHWTPLRHAALFACTWFIILLRFPDDTLWPSLINEDGAIMFKHYYENPGLKDLWLTYAGYVSAMPDVLAYLGASLPPRWVAHAYLLMATAWFAIAYSTFFLPRFRRFVPNDWHRALACLTLALLPLGNAALMRAVTYSFWSLLFVSTLISLVPGSRRAVVVFGEFVLLAINACSSPVSAILLPVLGWRAVRGRSPLERSLFLLVCLISIAYLAFSVDMGAETGSPWYAVMHAIPAFGDRVGFEPFLSVRLRMELIWRGLHWLSASVGWVILLAIGAWIASDANIKAVFRRERAACGWAAYVMAALTCLVLYSRFGPGGLDYASPVHQRYFWIQQCLVCLAVGIALFSDSRFERLRFQRKPRLVALVAGLTYLVALNLVDLQKSTAGRADGRAVAQFLGRIEACESAGGCAAPVALKRDRDERNSFEITRFRQRGIHAPP